MEASLQPQPGRPTNSVQPPTPRPAVVQVSALTLIIQVLAARALGFISTLGAIGIFGYAIYDPSQIRAATAGIYACGVMWPMVYLYLRKE